MPLFLDLRPTSQVKTSSTLNQAVTFPVTSPKLWVIAKCLWMLAFVAPPTRPPIALKAFAIDPMIKNQWGCRIVSTSICKKQVVKAKAIIVKVPQHPNWINSQRSIEIVLCDDRKRTHTLLPQTLNLMSQDHLSTPKKLQQRVVLRFLRFNKHCGKPAVDKPELTPTAVNIEWVHSRYPDDESTLWAKYHFV